MKAGGAQPASPGHVHRLGNVLAVAVMATAAIVGAVEALCVRWMTKRGIPIGVQVFARSLGQLLWVAPLIVHSGGFGVFRTARPLLNALRGLASLGVWWAYFLSLLYIDLATATVLSSTYVLLTALLAGPVLGERVGAVRWACAAAGTLGVALMMGPVGGILRSASA